MPEYGSGGSGGGGGGGGGLLAVAFGTDGATVTPSSGYADWNTPFSVTVTTTAIADVRITVAVTCKLSATDTLWLRLVRGSTQLCNTGNNTANTNLPHTYNFTWIDQALAAGTYTYKVQPGTSGVSDVCTLYNSSDAGTPNTSAHGLSVITVEQLANV